MFVDFGRVVVLKNNMTNEVHEFGRKFNKRHNRYSQINEIFPKLTKLICINHQNYILLQN